ncbi:hypothetical protein ACQ4M3_09740 [Leptolyngbya sp. AN03gr2]|uniref:hypothetical protein n=1 Tax=Leptolyngbya sp. AN03gr2 TaxID=3423364 RepID=UPI003D30FCDF
MTTLRLGITGYSAQVFNQESARIILSQYFDAVASTGKEIVIVSGLTNLGIPAIAYQLAFERAWKTVGIACSKAVEFPCFPCTQVIIEGTEWGQESELFLQSIDQLIRVGGGNQALKETEAARRKGIQVIEFDLPALVR